ncbi:MAG: DUF1127 domain-containing protein [Rhodobacteraceae bacterium]|nr:DUF1127 domain-containing protein [Paracoccaceae bacterium]
MNTATYNTACTTQYARIFGLPGVAVFTHMHSVWRQRRVLAALDPARLEDLGISTTDARAEAARPFWSMKGA